MNTSINTSPQETALRGAALDGFDVGLQRIGYPSTQIQRNYGFSNFVDDGRRETVDLAAFGNAVPSLRTCNIAVLVRDVAKAEDVVRFRALGAPLVFTYDARQKRLARWKMTAIAQPVLLEERPDISAERLADYFADQGNAWAPASFQQARAATFRPGPPQLDFFDIGLLPALEGQLQRKLSDQLQQSASLSREIVTARFGEAAFANRFGEYARLLFRLLAARMLSDRGDLPDLVQNADPERALEAVERKYYSKYTVQPALDIAAVRDQVWRDLRQGLDLRNLSPESLAFVYENTLVDHELRRRNGIHATPPLVADYLIRQLPVELLPEAQRVVFEPFCGNAPFLLAAMRRLRELLPPDRSPIDVHTYLTQRLLGLELLPVAREIAVCSLILGDYPNDNSWMIEQGDAFAGRVFKDFLGQAQIVVSNPPHENFTQDERGEVGHHNRAAEALKRVADASPQMLGFVMPLAFVDGNQYKVLRRQIADTYPYLSITALPRNVFSNTAQQVALLAAHRLGESDARRYTFARVSREGYRHDFPLAAQCVDVQTVSELPADEKGFPIFSLRHIGPSADLWQEGMSTAQYTTLETIADVHRGVAWRRIEGHSNTSDIEKPGYAPGLHLTDGVEVLFTKRVKNIDVDPDHQYPATNALHWPWADPKVLVTRVRAGSGIWRTFAVVDGEGLYASKTYVGVWPKMMQSTEDRPDECVSISVLGALLNSPIANAYLHQHCRERDNDQAHIRKIPVPRFTPAQCAEIDSLVDAYLDLRWSYVDEPVPWTGSVADKGRMALLKIDAAILDAYALVPSEEAGLLRLFDDVNRTHVPFDFSGYVPEELSEARTQLLHDREGRSIAEAFSALLRKRNLTGSLTDEEDREYERLLAARTRRRIQHREMLASGK